MDRRGFLIRTLLGLGVAPLAARLASASELSGNPFTLGIASGDPTDDSIVLWTRLAPDPLAANGGMPDASVRVQWELATDPDLSHVLRRGEVAATPALAHSVHIDIDGLEPNREYWYRFSAPPYQTVTGRTKTLPKGDSDPRSGDSDPGAVRFVVASCQNYTHGHFAAYDHMVEDNPDFVIHLGDYIYDTSYGETFRLHETEKRPVSVEDFRRRHALYKTDRQLQHAHAQLPFFTAIDNHDATEDADPDTSAMRTAAYQAWYEHMPVRGYGGIGANHFDLHRHIVLGNLAEISLLDGRQFRDDREICGNNEYPQYGFGNYRERCDRVFDEARTLLGEKQEKWLSSNLANCSATWNVMASPGPFLPFSYRFDDKDLRYIGAWDIYPANRARIAAALLGNGGSHPLILSGDVHSFWALDGRDVPNPDERFAVTEFVTSSISANWPEPLAKRVTENLAHNPQVKFYDPDRRGYLLHDVDKTRWKTTMRAVVDVEDEHSAVTDLATFVVDPGEPGFRRL
jgi:alkaline phosphatase D